MRRMSSKINFLTVNILKSIRKGLDTTWHDVYSDERIVLQNNWIITKTLGFNSTSDPRLIFTAGAMGAGKTHSLKKLADDINLDLKNTLIIDPDKYKDMIPEFEQYKCFCPENAGTLVHKESALLSELTLEYALKNKFNTVVDGSLNDWKWYSREFARIRKTYPSYKAIELFYVKADWPIVFSRTIKRGKETGRIINPIVLKNTYQEIPIAIKELESLVDIIYEVDNEAIPCIRTIKQTNK